MCYYQMGIYCIPGLLTVAGKHMWSVLYEIFCFLAYDNFRNVQLMKLFEFSVIV